MSFIALLQILFIALKLVHVIAWSWWIVLAPLWLIPAIPIVLFFGWVFGATGYGEYKKWARKHEEDAE